MALTQRPVNAQQRSVAVVLAGPHHRCCDPRAIVQPAHLARRRRAVDDMPGGQHESVAEQKPRPLTPAPITADRGEHLDHRAASDAHPGARRRPLVRLAALLELRRDQDIALLGGVGADADWRQR